MGRKGLWIALFASLAVNLFIVGALVGAGFAGLQLRPAAAAGGAGPHGPMARALAVLTPDERAAWRAGNPAFLQAYGPRMRQARQLHRQAMERFSQEPFPRAAILQDLAQARSLEQEARTAMDARFVDFAATLPPDERGRFAAALRPGRDPERDPQKWRPVLRRDRAQPLN